jgi:hypothetical protein
MKKIFLFLSILVSLASFGQGKFVGDGSFQGTGDYPITKFGYAQTGYYPMVRTTQRDSIPTWQRTYGMLVYCRSTDSTYMLTDAALGNTWTAFKLGSPADLSGYVTVLRFTDSLTNVQIRIQTKLNISDTSSMLSPYARTSNLPSLSGYVPYTGATTNVNLGNFKIIANKAALDSIQAKGSGGMGIYSNGGTKVADFGGGGGSQWTNYGFAGYDANRSASYTDRSFVDKRFTDSADALRVRYADSLSGGYTTWLRTKKVIDSLAGATVSGVSSFNSRTGAVVPLVGDYSSFYKGVADSFFTTGFTTRGRTKQVIDSLGAAKQNVLTNPITGSLTSGRIPFATGTNTLSDNSGLAWNNTSQTFAIASPTDGATAPFTINAARNGGYAFTYLNSTSNEVDARIINVLGSNGNSWGDWGVSGDGTTNILTQMYFRTPTSAPINFLTNGTNRMVIGGAGRILTNTTTDNGVDNFQVNGSLIATTLKSTTNTVSGNSTIGGTLGVTGAISADGGIITNGNVFQPLIVRRATNTVTAAVEVPFQMLNASSVYAPYAHIRSYIVANTAGSQSGGLRFSTYNAGADATQLEISNTGAITASNLAGTGTRAVEASSTGVLSATKIIDAGTYTPTLADYSLVSAATAYQCQYMRVGNVVTVSGKVSITSTSAGNTSGISMSVPISSTLGTDTNAGGTFGLGGNDPNGIVIAGGTNKVSFVFVPSAAANNPYWFTFTYLIN